MESKCKTYQPIDYDKKSLYLKWLSLKSRKVNNSCVKYEQLTILGKEPTHALPYIVSRKPTLSIH